MALGTAWDLVEADFQRYYALDLRTELEHAGVRRLSVLVEGLPPDSALQRDGRMWTQDNEIAAQGIELTQMWLAMVLSAWMQKGAKVPPIVPITHPHRHQAQPERKASAREVAERFAQARKRG